ncbi:MAG: hypothetical protein LUI60_02540 [Clostridia bacterium]|nr:hypothetical protein [Clostridia bacterium]
MAFKKADAQTETIINQKNIKQFNTYYQSDIVLSMVAKNTIKATIKGGETRLLFVV